jgi:hypothetical protein
MLRQLSQGGNFSHVLPNVQVGFTRNWAASSARSALDAFEQLVFLSELLSIHVIHHF